MKRINRTIAKLSLIFGLFISFFAQGAAARVMPQESAFERTRRISLQEEELRRQQDKEFNKQIQLAIAQSMLEQHRLQPAPSFDRHKAFKKIIKLTTEMGQKSPSTAVLMSNVYWPEINIGKDFADQWQGIKSQTPEFKQLMNDLKEWEQRQPTHVKPSGFKFIEFEEGEEATSMVVPAQEIFLWGLAARQGKRPTMEDDHDNRIMGSQAFFGVYDGHGGANAAKYTTKNLYNNFLAEKGAIPNRLIQAFEKTDQDIQQEMKDGTTAVVAFIDGNKAYIANAGDARALIIRNGNVITATKDHKPSDPAEEARIKAAGGKILYLTDSSKQAEKLHKEGKTVQLVGRGHGHRVIPRIVGKQGSLAVARSLGDRGYIGASATPDIYEQKLQNGDIIVLACDGLWDELSNEKVTEIVTSAIQTKKIKNFNSLKRDEVVEETGNNGLMTSIARMLRDTAYDRGSSDNISVLVVQVNNVSAPAVLDRPKANAILKSHAFMKQQYGKNFADQYYGLKKKTEEFSLSMQLSESDLLNMTIPKDLEGTYYISSEIVNKIKNKLGQGALGKIISELEKAQFQEDTPLQKYFFSYLPNDYHLAVKKQLDDELETHGVSFDEYIEKNLYKTEDDYWPISTFPFDKLDEEFSEQANNQYKARQAAWLLLSRSTEDFDVSQQWRSATWAVFGGPLFKGERGLGHKDVGQRTNILESQDEVDKDDREILVSQYKIHLMPKWKDLPNTIMKLFETIKKNSQLQNAIGHMKCSVLNIDLTDNYGQVVPRIVIYAADGKENAQLILDTVYALFKNQEGAGQTPRFNQKVNDLIYFAQGDADVKMRLEDKFLETKEKIYFNPNMIPSGAHDGYHLRIPSDS